MISIPCSIFCTSFASGRTITLISPTKTEKSNRSRCGRGDVVNLLGEPAPYGYSAENAPDYFSRLIARVNAVDPEKLSDLTQLLTRCEQLKNEALLEIQNEKYSFNELTESFRQDNYDALYDKWYSLYAKYTVDFMQRWEL